MAEKPANLNSVPIIPAGLTESQRRAIFHEKGPLLIISGPGAGKTDTIVRRAAYLVSHQNVAPERLLIVTFTNKAAEELCDRLWYFLRTEAYRIHISTIHSFCHSVLERFSYAHPYGAGFRILDEREQFLFVYARLKDLGLNRFPKGRLGDFIFDVISFFNLCTEEFVSPEELLKTIKKEGGSLLNLKKPSPEAVEEYEGVAEAYSKYLEILCREAVLDFAGLQRCLYEMLRSNPEIREELASQYQYLLVDEYQDTNRIQVEIFKELSRPKYNITAVGDDDQSIYKFRGATVKSFLRFEEDFPGSQKIYLDINFRSTPEIVRTSSALIKHNAPGRREKSLKAHNKEKFPPILVPAPNCREEAETVIKLIARLRKDGIISNYSHIAILFRSVKYHAGEYLEALNRHNIPYTVVSDGSFFDREDIYNLQELIRFCGWKKNWDPGVFRGKLLELSPNTVRAITKWKEDPTAWTDKKILEELGITDSGEQRVLTELAGIRSRTGKGALRDLMLLFYELLRCTGYFARCCKGSDGECEAALLNLAQFSRILDDFRYHVRSQNTYRLHEFLRSLPSRSLDELKPEPPGEAVKVMTVHQSKGLEFPVVIIGSAMEGRFPGRFRHPKYPIPAGLRLSKEEETYEEHLRDQRRLFYVAMTRAEELLIIGAPEKVNTRGQGKSSFIKEIGEGLFCKADITASEKNYMCVGMRKLKKKLPPVRKRLSYSAVHCYLLCPLQYKILYECDFAVPGGSYFRFGSALHKCLELIHQLAKENREINPEIVEKIFSSVWKPDRYMDKEMEQKQRELGLSYLNQYVAGYSERFNRIVWIEESLELPVGDTVMIHGRLDLACKAESELEIIDFKVRTRKGLEVIYPQFQLETYGLAVEISRNVQIKQLFVHLMAANPGQELVPFPWNREISGAAERRLGEAVSGIMSRNFEPRPGKHCLYCDFKKICPESIIKKHINHSITEDEKDWETTIGVDP